MAELEERFGAKTELLYADFICKVEGELSRRNRLRTDMEAKLHEVKATFGLF